ncbi:6349_t:CDS:2, partial [Funneliformis mosseae]
MASLLLAFLVSYLLRPATTGFLLVPAFLDSEIGPDSLDSGFLGPIPDRNSELLFLSDHTKSFEKRKNVGVRFMLHLSGSRRIARQNSDLTSATRNLKDMEALNATFVPASEENEVIPAVD